MRKARRGARATACAGRGIVRQMFAFEHGSGALLGPLLGAGLCMFILRALVLLCASATRSRDLRAIARAEREAAANRASPQEDSGNARSA